MLASLRSFVRSFVSFVRRLVGIVRRLVGIVRSFAVSVTRLVICEKVAENVGGLEKSEYFCEVIKNSKAHDVAVCHRKN